MIKSKFLLSWYEYLWVVQYGESGWCDYMCLCAAAHNLSAVHAEVQTYKVEAEKATTMTTLTSRTPSSSPHSWWLCLFFSSVECCYFCIISTSIWCMWWLSCSASPHAADSLFVWVLLFSGSLWVSKYLQLSYYLFIIYRTMNSLQ